jgi:aminoglycoside phosphotransferase (APT) family kinase protein
LGPKQISLLVAALREIHTAETSVKIVSSTPRNLDLWWIRTHEAFRELHAPGLSTFHESAAGVLNTLVHPIAADAQAHKRFWAAAPLTLVHGSPETENVRYSGERLALVNWECFGRGDPALEVATWAGLIDMWTGKAATQRFIDDYLVDNEDELLSKRIEIYNRFWPFGYLLPLLAQARTAGRSLTESKARTLVECFARLMRAYERPEEEIDEVRTDMDAWLGLGAVAGGTQDGRG